MSNVLDLELDDNDANASTVREYLITLLETLWCEEESFSGKRPFGNSGWQFVVYDAIEKAGIKGDPVRLMTRAIRSLGEA